MPTNPLLRRLPIHDAAIDGEISALQARLTEGEDPNARDAAGWTPLHFAAQRGSGAHVRALLDAGANPNLQDTHGNTPLFRAVFAYSGACDIVRLLLERGADAELCNAHGVSALGLAKTIANFDVLHCFGNIDQQRDA